MPRVVLSWSDGHHIAPLCVRADIGIKVESHEAVRCFKRLGILVRWARPAASHRRPNRELNFNLF